MARLEFSLLSEALEKVFWHILDSRVRVDSGQDPVVLTEQLVQHQQREGWRGRIGVDDNVLQRTVVLGRDAHKAVLLPSQRLALCPPGSAQDPASFSGPGGILGCVQMTLLCPHHHHQLETPSQE